MVFGAPAHTHDCAAKGAVCWRLILYQINEHNAVTRDGGILRHNRKRWKNDWLFASLKNFPRLVVHCKDHVDKVIGFVELLAKGVAGMLRSSWQGARKLPAIPWHRVT